MDVEQTKIKRSVESKMYLLQKASTVFIANEAPKLVPIVLSSNDKVTRISLGLESKMKKELILTMVWQ